MAESAKHIVGEIYSEVLFELAEEAGRVETVLEDLESVADILTNEPEFASILSSHAIKGDEKAQIIRRVFGGKVADLTLNFLSVLARRGRMAFLSRISDKYELLVDVYRQRTLIEVTVAKEPEEEEIVKLKADLSKAINGEVKLSVQVDPDIIGGIIIKKGDKVIDNSVKKSLEGSVKSVMTRAKQGGRFSKDDNAGSEQDK
jgi:F-type H+-transporting ATPase subunit delta